VISCIGVIVCLMVIYTHCYTRMKDFVIGENDFQIYCIYWYISGSRVHVDEFYLN
ncbi:hypothetical protein L9F63_027061, partial [Diploptera punctata]